MPKMTIRRKRLHYVTGEAEPTVEYIEEVRHWPMMTCLTFKQSYPDAFVKIEQDDPIARRPVKSSRVRTEYEHKPRATKSRAKSSEPKEVGSLLAETINDEVASL